DPRSALSPQEGRGNLWPPSLTARLWGMPGRFERSVSHDGCVLSCAAAAIRFRLGSPRLYWGAAVGGFLAARGGPCHHLDDPALRPLCQPAARPHRGAHLRARVATRLRQIAALALVAGRDRPPRRRLRYRLLRSRTG